MTTSETGLYAIPKCCTGFKLTKRNYLFAFSLFSHSVVIDIFMLLYQGKRARYVSIIIPAQMVNYWYNFIPASIQFLVSVAFLQPPIGIEIVVSNDTTCSPCNYILTIILPTEIFNFSHSCLVASFMFWHQGHGPLNTTS